jgi:hypothetical protein
MHNRNCGRALSARELVDSDGGEASTQRAGHRNNSTICRRRRWLLCLVVTLNSMGMLGPSAYIWWGEGIDCPPVAPTT